MKENNLKSRDYTIPPPGQPGLPASGMGLPGPGLTNSFAPNQFASNQFGPQFGGPSGFSQIQPGFAPMGPIGAAMPVVMSGPVVLVNKLSESKGSMDLVEQIFILFGVYGDVLRVKILFNKRDTAMVQFRTPQQASLAVKYLNGCVLNDLEIVVTHSRAVDVKLPLPNVSDEQGGTNLTRDYSTSTLHRYRNQAVMNLKNVNPPSLVLHVAYINNGTTVQELSTLFGSIQSTPAIVEFFKSDRKMAYIVMRSLPDAIKALIAFHNYQLGQYNIRVSFSHKDPATVVMSE